MASSNTPPPGSSAGSTGSLYHLTPTLQVGLIPVALFGFISAASASGLLFLLTWRIWAWNRKARHANQFVFLIYNLVLADIQQSMAFLLNAKWLATNSIIVGTSTCWAQGWFVSTGDMGSGVWAFAIGLHTFATVIFGYRLSNSWFAVWVILCWCLIYGLALAGVAIHPDLYVRAVSWCWVNPKYSGIRLWLHYFWIFVFEFGTVVVYTAMILALRVRVQTNFYRSAERTRHAQDAAKLMIAYPIIYVVCTLPLATLRMYSMANPDVKISGGWFCFAGAMITSNGWMDVLLYTMTRRITLFSDEPPATDNGIESFFVPWKKDNFGTETTCEYVPDPLSSTRGRDYGYQTHHDSLDGFSHGEGNEPQELVYMKDKPCRQQGKTDLIGFVSITEKTTVEVKSEPMTNSQKRAVKAMKESGVSLDGGSRGRHNSVKDSNSDGSSMRQLWVGSRSHGSSHEDVASTIRGADDTTINGGTTATPHSERSISETYEAETMEFRTRARGL